MKIPITNTHERDFCKCRKQGDNYEHDQKTSDRRRTAVRTSCRIDGMRDCRQRCGKGYAETAAETAADTAGLYPYEKQDLGGYTLRIYNIDDLWDMFVKIDTEATDGEILNDTLYKRNRQAESDLNFVIEETRLFADDFTAHNKTIQNAVLAGEDTYDITYAGINSTPALITEGFFRNLLDLDGLHLEDEWWDPIVTKNAIIDDCLYFATSPMQMMPYDSAWILFFNEDIMAANDLEKPYDLVREGKWTLDALNAYIKPIANLNGDSSFVWNANGNAFYGMSCHPNAPDHFLISAGETIVETANDGTLVFTAEGERFHRAVSALASVFDKTAGGSLEAHTTDFDAELGGYMHVFHSGRSLFLTAEIKAAQLLRDMEATFGMVPIPKLDEQQEMYLGDFVSSCVFYAIPVTNTHLTETAAASDYLSYLSNRDLLPVYYNTVVEQKGLRNQDSIEMLDIVLSSKTVDLSTLFGWNASLVSSLRAKYFSGNDDVASIIEREKKKIDKSIADTLEAITYTKENT